MQPDTVALFGAGGKIGARIAGQLMADPSFRLLAVEPSEAGRERLARLGIQVVDADAALAEADLLVLAVPDRIMAAVARDVVPKLRPGCLLVQLDPAAAHAGVLPDRAEVGLFVAHPCHPPLFEADADPATRDDWYGGRAAQSVVCALVRGTEADYERGARFAAAVFQPILRLHRITLEQMALLEPGLVETTALGLLSAVRDALDRVIAEGVPEAAARDFLLGHLRIELAIVLGIADIPISDGARLAMEDAKRSLLRPDWLERAVSPGSVRAQVRAIVGAED
ncbi:MAG: phosphogluconate dehydrogenase C-terminal domain-containing protein [Armatimonadota bacterium]